MAHAPADIAARLNLTLKGSKWVGPCPKCGGSAKSDKFNLHESGGFICRGCDFKGNRIKWLREMEGLSCPEAHRVADQRCESTTCPVFATCSEGRGEKGPRGQRRAVSATLAPPTRVSSPRTATPTDPAERWNAWAVQLWAASTKSLQAQPEVLAWLAARGLPASVVKQNELGWLDHPRKVDRASIGLTPERDGKTTLWIPAGLVISIFDLNCHLQRLAVRRTDEDRARFLPDLKYAWIEGSSRELLIIPAIGPERGVLIIEAELDAMACAAAHHGVTVIALSTVNATLTPSALAAIESAPVILVALDADPERTLADGRTIAPGRDAAAIWCKNWRQAKYWPVPVGKDAGDYAKEGGDLHAWIESGLPAPLSAAVPAQKLQSEAPLPLPTPAGGTGEEVKHQRSKVAPELMMHISPHRDALAALWKAYPGEVVLCTTEVAAIAALGDLEAAYLLRLRATFGPGTALISSTPIEATP